MRLTQKSFLILSVLLLGCNGNESTNAAGDGPAVELKLKGSDTVLPVSQQLAEEYMKANKSASITVTGGGSGVGIASLLDGTTDIGMTSRDLKLDEKLKFTEKNKELIEVVVAFDALSVVVHPGNPVEQLTREELEGIFTGRITNWKEVGGNDERIISYSRESSSGTYEFFKEEVMNKKNYASGILMMTATGGIVQSVSQTPGAIGYIGIAYQTESVKPLKVSYDQGKTYVAPSVEAALDKTYPISRPLYYLFTSSSAATVKPFLDYALSTEGQEIVKRVGYIPVN